MSSDPHCPDFKTITGYAPSTQAAAVENRDYYRFEAERCERDGIRISFFGPTINCVVSRDDGLIQVSLLILSVLADPNPEEWPHQARELVNKVHRYREMLRQAGCEI